MKKPQASQRHKVYKFGLYGRAGSGKTCLLAALAMQRIAHPKQLSCTWIPEPPDMPPPPGEPQSWDEKNPAAAFYLGKQWMDEAITCLLDGKTPPPNPNREPLRFLYDFSTTEHRTFRIELIDYSGELLDPLLAHEELAERLREHMVSMDGLLVLAEAPYRDGNIEPLSKELFKLEQAFAILRDEARNGAALQLPIALLINKWDRHHPLAYDNPAQEHQVLQQFLDSQPEPPHRALVNVLRNSVTADNFAVFPVSAFGEHEIHPDGTEAPKQVRPLKSFGLEDAFVYAAQQRDAIDLAQYEAAIATLSPWRFWQPFTQSSPWRLFRHGQRLAARLPDASEQRSRVATQTRHAARMFGSHILVTFCIALLLLLTGEGVYDGIQFQSIQATSHNPEATEAHLKASEQWLEHYASGGHYRHFGSQIFVLSSAQALQKLHDSQKQRDEKAWLGVTEVKDPLKRRELATEYQDKYGENGTHSSDARRLLEQQDTNSRWQAFVEGYNTLIQNKDIKGGLTHLEAAWPDQSDAEWQKIRTHFKDLIIPLIQARVQGPQKAQQWAKAYQEIKDVKNDTRLSEILGAEQHKHLATLQKQVEEAHDKQLYQNVVQYQDYKNTNAREKASEYLEQAPLKTMQRAVEGHRAYLDKMAQPLSPSLSLERIAWGGLPWASHNCKAQITVEVDGQPVISAIATTHQNGGSDQMGTGQLPLKKLDETIKLVVKLRLPGKLCSEIDNLRTEPWRIKVQDLGKDSIALSNDQAGISATFKLAGLPAPEKLPEWGNAVRVQ